MTTREIIIFISCIIQLVISVTIMCLLMDR